MEVGGALDWGIVGLLVVVTILLFMGKGDFLFRGIKGDRKDLGEVYDLPKLKKTTGFIALSLLIVQLCTTLFGKEIKFLVYLYIPMILVIMVLGNIQMRKCKK